MRKIFVFIKHGLFSIVQLFAFLLRKLVPVFETLAPPLARKMRSWGWVWQPIFGHGHLNKYYEKEDPFNFASPYEIGKYQHTIQLLKPKTYKRALEVGAAEGIFTEMLAPLCEEVLGVEVAEAAVERAQARLQAFPHANVVLAALPADMPGGKFDLIILSDVMYYFPKDVTSDLIARFESALSPNGILFSLHYLGGFGTPITGAQVHEIMRDIMSAKIIHEERVPKVGPGGKGYDILIFQSE